MVKLVAEVDQEAYDDRSKLLSIRVLFQNKSDKKIYLVANEFVFLKMKGTVRRETDLRVHKKKKDKKLVFDVSKAMPTARGIRYYQMHGLFGVSPETWEIGPGKFRYITYVFQFPLQLDDWKSNVDSVSGPVGKWQCGIRVGFGNEPFEDFRRRLASAINKSKIDVFDEAVIKKWHEQVVRKWQQTVETGFVEVDFLKRGR